MAMMFYMTPGSCSTGIHILLEMLELPFEVTVVDLLHGAQRRPEYLALNPKGTIPALRLVDGEVLTEFAAIAYWLARSHPRARLLPDDPLRAARALELMNHVVGTVHGQGFTRIFTPEAYLPPGRPATEATAWHAALQAQGRDIVDANLRIIDARLPEVPDVHVAGDAPDAPFALGADFSIADAALFYVEFWADKIGAPLPPRCAAHYRRVRALPVVQRVLREEGYR